MTDLRHPPIAIPMRGNCPHTDRCSSFVSISKPTCGSHSDRRQRRNTKSKSTHMSMSMRQQHGTTSHGIITCSFKYNYLILLGATSERPVGSLWEQYLSHVSEEGCIRKLNKSLRSLLSWGFSARFIPPSQEIVCTNFRQLRCVGHQSVLYFSR